MRFGDFWITHNHASKVWEVWHEGENEKMKFIGKAKTYKAARKLGKRVAA